MHLLVLGFGHVGRSFSGLLPNDFEASFFIRNGGIIRAPPERLQQAAKASARLDSVEGFVAQNPMDAVQNLDYDVLVDLSPTNLETAEPSSGYWRAAFERGKHVVTANKGPLAFRYAEMKALAEQNDAQLLFEATVAGGTPVFSLARHCLNGAQLERVEGIVNGTSNYILSQMEKGNPYESALKEAQEKGYAEADPRSDVGGFDALAKAVILANALFGQDARFKDHKPEGIESLTLDAVQSALKAGEHYKLIANVDRHDLGVSLRRLPSVHPLARIGDAWNALSFYTKHADAVTISGRGAGGVPTASAVLNDVLEIQAALKH